LIKQLRVLSTDPTTLVTTVRETRWVFAAAFWTDDMELRE
jgi:hypothetical protein